MLKDLGLEDADIREVAVGPGVVEPVPDDELVGHLEAEVPDVELRAAPGRLGEEGADLERGRPPGVQGTHQVRERKPRVYDVLDDEYVTVRDVLFEVLEDAYDAARGAARTVGAYVHEVQLALQVYAAHQVAHDNDRAAQDAYKERLLTPVILGDASPDLAHLLLELPGGYEHLFHVRHHTGHAHEILTTSNLKIFSVPSSTLNASPSSPPDTQATSPRPSTTTGVLRLRSPGTFLSII